MPCEVLEQRSWCHPQRGGGGRVGFRDHRHVALQRADHGDVELVVGLGSSSIGSTADGRAGERLGVALHLEVHADLEQLQRRQLAHRLGAGSSRASTSSVPSRPSSRVGLGGDREPQVELVVAQVVVRDAGVGVDHLRGAVGVLGIDLGRHEHRGVAERARVEDRRDLADDALRRAGAGRASITSCSETSAAARRPPRRAGARSGSCPASGSAACGRGRRARPPRRPCGCGSSASRRRRASASLGSLSSALLAIGRRPLRGRR